MRFRLFLCFVLCCGFALAQEQMTVGQLVDVIRSSLALQHDDKKISDYVKKVKLTEKLTDKTIQDLLAQGAGPKTIDALKKLHEQTANLKPPATDSTYSPATAPNASSSEIPSTTLSPKKSSFPPPDSVKQQEILDGIKQYASTYSQSLPNFICTQVTARFAALLKGNDSWHFLERVTQKLGYENGHETYQTVLVNNQPIVGNVDAQRVKGGTVSSGEFGTLMNGIFESRSKARFEWDHWGNLDGKLMAVYSYFIDSGHSEYSIDYNGEQRIVTAYKGLIYADQYTGVIYRIKFDAVDIPSSFPVRSATEILDYNETDISGSKYICPQRAQVFLESNHEKTKNDIEFRLYKRFGTESFITYKVDNSAQPMPDKGEKPLTSAPASQEPDIPLPPNSAPPPPPDSTPHPPHQ